MKTFKLILLALFICTGVVAQEYKSVSFGNLRVHTGYEGSVLYTLKDVSDSLDAARKSLYTNKQWTKS